MYISEDEVKLTGEGGRDGVCKARVSAAQSGGGGSQGGSSICLCLCLLLALLLADTA